VQSAVRSRYPTGSGSAPITIRKNAVGWKPLGQAAGVVLIIAASHADQSDSASPGLSSDLFPVGCLQTSVTILKR